MGDGKPLTGFGARWWRASLLRLSPGVASFGLAGGLVGGALVSGCAFDRPDTRMEPVPSASDDADAVEQQMNALQLQQQAGWNVGDDRPLDFPGSTDVDVAGTQAWRAAMDPLANILAPAPKYQPYYVPTLYQSLMGEAGQGLRAVMRPMATNEMQEDFARGLALRRELGDAGFPRDLAVVVDAPGPRAVAMAAALADRFAPVFTFGNWPHPLGVVPAHQTIAASLYYLPAFQAANQLRRDDAPPLFVLDANRLAPYRDEDGRFDNRYFVSLPTADSLRALGVRHVLYVTADGRQELDDLNEQLVALQSAGVDVKMVALGDFVRAADAVVSDDEVPDNEEVAAADVGFVAEPDLLLAPYPWLTWWGRGWRCHHWYRGAYWGGVFWGDYGWYHGRHAPVVVAPPPGRVVVRPPIAARWVAAPRPTMFAPGRTIGPPGARGVVYPRAAGFGTMPVRASRGSGVVTGVHLGHGVAVIGRSGSFGRAGGGGFGGG